jgi:hypothetical protein
MRSFRSLNFAMIAPLLIALASCAGPIGSASKTQSEPPTITTQPANVTVTAGQPATFSVNATGTAPLNYQWMEGGSNISGATSVTYTVSSTTVGMSGEAFSVSVSNAYGTEVSAAATLTVNPAATAPTITTQPVNQTVTAGQNATFTVAASGTAPLTYQWQMNGGNIANTNSASYTVTSTTTAQSGTRFDVIVSNSEGSVTSSTVTLTVNAAATAPAITTQPASQSVTAGQNATFTVAASGTAPLTYQWQLNGSNIANTNAASYTVSNTAVGESGEKFDVIVSNAAGSVTSNMATLTVTAAAVAPTITTQPASQTVTAGQNATFSVAASGTAPLSYQWQLNGTNIPNAISSSYAVTNTTTAESGEKFDVVVSNTAGSVTSNMATLTVNPAPVAPSITTQPLNQSVVAGQNATFTVVASGTAPLTYQWQMNGNNIANSNAASYTVTNTTVGESGEKFDVIVSNGQGSITSNMVTLTVTAAVVAPTITTQPASQTVTASQNATFTVVAAGTAPLTYQWQMNGNNIANTNSPSYTVTNTTVGESGEKFDVIVSNTAGSITSNMATLTVNAATVPTITTQPASQSVTAGQNATFTVAAAGTAPLTYQWQANGVNIPNTNATSYTVMNTTASESGENIDVVVSNVAGSITSNVVTLTVNSAPTITTQPANQTVTAGQNATFTVVAAGTAPLTYQWQLNGSNIANTNSASYTVSNTTVGESGEKFDVIVSNSAGSVTSNMATLTVNPAAVAPTITTQPASQTVTAGQNATFTVAASGTAPLTYQWQMNGSNIANSNSPSHTVTSATTAENGDTFDVIVSNTAGSITSNVVTLTVNAAVAPGITTQPANVTVTAGQNATFTVVATGSAPLTYQWQINGGNIANSNAASYTETNTTTAESGDTFDVIVTNAAGSITSNTATLTVNAAAAGTDVTTYHNDVARDGLNATETALTTANVNYHTFGLILTIPVDGLVDAEPLFLSSVNVGGTAHDIVFIATENDSVYAVDANSFATLWHDGPGTLLPSGETASDEPFGCNQIGTEIGITSTPVIDRTAGANGTIFLVTMSVDGSGNHHQRIHALDITTGAELLGGPTEIQATIAGVGAGSSGGVLTFSPISYKERAALLLLNGTIYTTWASHCDAPPYSPWVIGYSESTLARNVVFNLAPNGADTSNGQYGAGSVWMSGGGPAADPQGNIYVALANGAFETTLTAGGFPNQGDYGNALVKMTPGSGSLAVTDYFNMSSTLSESDNDTDLGSGGVMVLPDLTDGGGHTKELVVAAGKDSNMYVADRTNMGKFNATQDKIYQELNDVLPSGVWAVAAYFNGTIYYCDQGDYLWGFPITNALVSSSPIHSFNGFGYPGLLPSVSANGTSNGIVWGVENTTTAVLHAFDAGTLGELYNTQQAPNGEDTFGGGNKFMTPMIANGKVFVGTPNSVAIFGLLATPR